MKISKETYEFYEPEATTQGENLFIDTNKIYLLFSRITVKQQTIYSGKLMSGQDAVKNGLNSTCTWRFWREVV